MLPIQYKKDGENVGLIVDPKNGDYLSENYTKTLLNYIKRIFENTDYNFVDSKQKELFNNLSVNDKGFYTNDLSDGTLLDNIVLTLNKIITEKLIVNQIMGQGPDIRHRVFNFSTNLDNQIEIKYTELGDFNSIDNALKNILTIYNL